MRSLPGRQLLGLPVRVGGGEVGNVQDLVLGADLGVALGFIVSLRGGRRGFLPWLAVSAVGDAVAAPSPATLLGEIELAFYVDGGVRLTRLAGQLVADDAAEAGVVGDVLVELSDGRVTALVVTDSRGTRELDLGDARIRWTAGSMIKLTIARGRDRRDLAAPAPRDADPDEEETAWVAEPAPG